MTPTPTIVAYVVMPHAHRIDPKIHDLASSEQLLRVKHWTNRWSARNNFESAMGTTLEQAIARFKRQPVITPPDFDMVMRKLVEVTLRVRVTVMAFDAEGREQPVEPHVELEMPNV
jgi:hypothetical protein